MSQLDLTTLAVERLVEFDAAANETPESIAIDRNGNRYVSLALTGEIRKIAQYGAQSTLATLPVGNGVALGLALDRDGAVYASVASFEGNAEVAGVWRVTPDGASARLAPLPPQGLANGITFDPDGNLYAADSFMSTIWRIARGGDQAIPWLQSPLLDPDNETGFPGANGLQYFGGSLYISVSAQGTILRVPISSDGSAGTPAVHVGDLIADDFAFDVTGNLYVTTHPFNTVERVSVLGTTQVLLKKEDGLSGPTAAAFGRRGLDRLSLYVTNGAVPQFTAPGDPRRPSLMRLTVGLPGFPRPMPSRELD